MSAPILRTSEGKVIISVHIKDFAPGKDYRIAVASSIDSKIEATVELTLNDTPLSVTATKFKQKNPGQWWGVSQFNATGFELKAAQLPPAGQDLVLKAEVDHDEATAVGKLYVFVARDYGSDTWYLEDGSEIDKSVW